MFKKLCVLVLAVGTSYAMEDITNTPTGDDNIKQTVEEVKQPTGDSAQVNVTENETSNTIGQLDSANINKVLQHIKNVKNSKSNTQFYKNVDEKVCADDLEAEKQFCTKYGDEILFDINTLTKSKKLSQMTAEEKDWAKIAIYDNFSKKCQKFWQDVFQKKTITDNMIYNFCKLGSFRECVTVGFEPLTILKDELKFNIYPTCIINANLFALKPLTRRLSYMVSRHTRRLRYHFGNLQSLQERFPAYAPETVSKIYWDNFWKNFSTLNKEY